MVPPICWRYLLTALTRVHKFDAVERALQESKKTGKAVLNGFAAVNVGVAGNRLVTDSLECSHSVQVRDRRPQID